MWDAWSQQADSYNARDARDVWKSVRANGKVTAGTLFHEARANGWRDDGTYRKPTPEELAERDRREQENEGARQRAQEDAAKKAVAILVAATGDPATHPYGIKKRVSLGPLVKRDAWPQRGWPDALLIPIYGGDGRVWSIEAINADGDKDFLAGGKTAGGFHPFGKVRGASRVFIAEGIANAAVGVEVDKSPAVAALCAGNLRAVALAMREVAAPDADIIILADNDAKPDGSNPGLKAADEAAAAVDGRVVIPELDGRKCDLWDVWNEHGIEAVRSVIANAQAPGGGIGHQPGTENATAGAGEVSDWPEPQPLPSELPAVEPFAEELLPAAIKPWAMDICDRTQCPPDYVGAAVMAALGATIGRKLGIRPQAQTDWTEYPNQWAVIIGRPGVLKSPAMEAALAPLKRLQAKEGEAYQSAVADYERSKQIAKLKTDAAETRARDVLKKDPRADVSAELAVEKPEAPVMRRFIANDTSCESLGELLRQNPGGVLVYRDEIVSLLKTLDREENAGARGFYLTGWGGASGYTFDRIGRGLNLHIPAVCLSVLGSTQPGRIAEYIRVAVKGGARDDGLIQRFGLMVWPDIGSEWRDVDRWPDTEARRQAHEIFQKLANLDPATIGAHRDEYAEAHYLRFDDRGLERFREWRALHERKLRGGELHPALESHLAKYRKLVPGLALVCHLVDRGSGLVSEQAVLRSLSWGEYLESHARRAYASVTMPKVSAAKIVLARIRKGELKPPFGARDIYRNCWAGLSDREIVQDALDLLVDLDWLRERTIETSGRHRTVYDINPRALP